MATFTAAHILMLTNDDDEQLREAAMSAGARGYVLNDNLLDLWIMLQSKCD